jgi:hypothetical protein
MNTSWILAIALMTQSASPSQTKPATPEKPTATVQAKGPDQKSTIQSTIARRKATKARKNMARTARQMKNEEDTKASLDRAERLAPVVAAQQREAQMLQLEAQRTQAMQQMSNAMMQNALTNQMRYRLQTQQAGVPQVYSPNQGIVPYPGAIAPPLPYAGP